MSPALSLTVVIPVKNESQNLPICLAALKGVENIVLIDSGSTDDTLEIGRAAGAEILEFEWDGHYPKKRNWYLLNHAPNTDWVMFLDADEVVSPEFLTSLEPALADNSLSGYWLQYTNYFLGKELRHGIAQRKLALFRVGSGLYEKIDETGWSQLDMEIHEHPIINGKIGEISARIDHRDFRGLARFLDRHVDYARWETQRLARLGPKGSANWATLTKRQTSKYSYLSKWWFAPAYFLNAYIFKGGFLDGVAGYHYAYYKAWYFHSIRLMIQELDKSELC